MKQILENLLRIQNLELGIERATAGSGLEESRKKVPGQILEQYDRLRARGKKGVAFVRHGVCGQCHMQIAVGVVAMLRRQDNIMRCQNCGAYLQWKDEAAVLEMPAPRAVEPARRCRPSKNATAHAA